MRPDAERSVMDALPTADAASFGKPGTRMVSAGSSGPTSTRRTDPMASARTSAV